MLPQVTVGVYRVFLPSAYELAFGSLLTAPEGPATGGAVLAYFKGAGTTGMSDKRVAKLNGSAVAWWTRSACVNNSTRTSEKVIASNTYGAWVSDTPTESKGVRPTLILPSDVVLESIR